MQNSTQRFSNRVEDYVKYRPHYPPEIIPELERQALLMPGTKIADIGSGTGISSALFLKEGYPVWGVEPNREMRRKSAELLRAYPDFHAVNGTAEATTLPGHSTGLIVAGQAFHWFNRDQCRSEFERILKPGGAVVLIWNERLTSTPFEKAYEQLIMNHGNHYLKVDHRNIGDTAIAQFFAPKEVILTVFDNRQILDYEGLEGRLLSSSYMPVKGGPGYPEMVADLKKRFHQFQTGNRITIHYRTRMYACRLA